jgi:hypothetical protein
MESVGNSTMAATAWHSQGAYEMRWEKWISSFFKTTSIIVYYWSKVYNFYMHGAEIHDGCYNRSKFNIGLFGENIWKI